jgi:hypothetical protein
MEEQNWIAQVKERVLVLEVAAALGLKVQDHSFGPCPKCNAERRGKGERRPPCGVTNGGKGWKCWTCNKTGDAVTLVALVTGGNPPSKGDGKGWAAVRAECARRGWCDAADARKGPQKAPGLRRGRARLSTLAATPSTPPVDRAANAVRTRPPPEELSALWDAAGPVTADAGVTSWAKARPELDLVLVGALDLARVLDGNSNPAWWPYPAVFRLAALAFDARGERASLQARAVALARNGKTRNPKGYSPGPVWFANAAGQAMLRGEAAEDLAGVLVCEGLTDWLATSCAADREGLALAVLGAIEGSWAPLAEVRLPEGVPVYLAPDVGDKDGKGDHYAEKARKALAGRPAVFRVPLAPPPGHDGKVDLCNVLGAGARLGDDGDTWGLLHLAREDGPMERDKEQGAAEDTPAGTAEEWRAEQLAKRLATLDAGRVGVFLNAELARMRARAEKRELPIPLPWPSVADELGGGLWPGCYVLVGNTGSGKSQWALQAALHAARAAVPVLYVGLELGRLDLVARLVGLVSGRKWSRLYLGTDPAELTEVEDRHGEALAELGRVPFHLAMAPPHGWAYPELADAAEDMRRRYPEDSPGACPMLIVLDFLQLVGGKDGAREDLRERIGKAAYAGRAVARDYNAAVLMLSSTAREHYFTLAGEQGPARNQGANKPTPLGKGNPARLVGLGKESGDVEYAADAALVLAQEPWPGDSPPKEGTHCWLAVAKVRARSEGMEGWAELRFDGGRFFEPSSPVKVSL